jgi:transcription factor IIIB subunit 2
LAKADEEEPVLEFSPKSGEVLCKHKDKGVEHFAHGLCEKCYNKVIHIYYVCDALVLILHSPLTHDLIVQFTKLSGGLEGGADPPAFQRAEKLRLEAAKKAEEAAAMNAETVCEIEISDAEHNIMSPMKVIIMTQI